MSVSSLYNSTFTLQTENTDNTGNGDPYVTKTENIKCWKHTRDPQYITTNKKGEYIYTHSFFCSAIDIDQTRDRISDTEGNYEIVSILPIRWGSTVSDIKILARDTRYNGR